MIAPTQEPFILKKLLIIELKRENRREKRKRGKWVSIEEAKEREKRSWENRKGEGNFRIGK
jgi:hypothetical protein